MKSPCLNARALILSLQPCSGQNDSGMTNLSFRAGNEWAGVLLFPYREHLKVYHQLFWHSGPRPNTLSLLNIIDLENILSHTTFRHLSAIAPGVVGCWLKNVQCHENYEKVVRKSDLRKRRWESFGF